MPTGACGIDCDVCGLHIQGVCSTCGAGGSLEAKEKILVQEKVLGAPCPILACARKNGIEHCLKDCGQFPCALFRGGPYPFSDGYLAMQDRRRKALAQTDSPLGGQVHVPEEYWGELLAGNFETICEYSLARMYSPHGLILTFLGHEIMLDVEERCIKGIRTIDWERIQEPLLELICLIYALNAGPEGLQGDLVSAQELKNAHFFQGPHRLDLDSLLKRYGRDVEGFRRSAEFFGGKFLSMADAAYRIPALPKIPLYYLLWEGDDEFEPRFSVLFDRSVEKHLPADALWGLVRLVSQALSGEKLGFLFGRDLTLKV